jgi:hypothetical protein
MHICCSIFLSIAWRPVLLYLSILSPTTYYFGTLIICGGRKNDWRHDNN